MQLNEVSQYYIQLTKQSKLLRQRERTTQSNADGTHTQEVQKAETMYTPGVFYTYYIHFRAVVYTLCNILQCSAMYITYAIQCI